MNLSDKAQAKPMIKEPRQLTAKVPQGKTPNDFHCWLMILWVKPEIKNLLKAPMPPPAIILIHLYDTVKIFSI